MTGYDLDELKRRNDAREVARELKLNFKTTAGAKWTAFCFAHDDRTTGRPNLVVSQDGAICFRCGWKGDVIDLVMGVQKVDKAKAIRFLAERVGMKSRGGDWKTDVSHQLTPAPPPSRPLPDPTPSTSPSSPPTLDAGWPNSIVAGDRLRCVSDGVVTRAGDDYQVVDVYSWGICVDVGPKTVEPINWKRVAASFEPIRRTKTLRVRVYEALLSLSVPAFATQAGDWLRTKKNIADSTMTEFGIVVLYDWEAADRQLKAEFGVDALASLGLTSQKTGNLHFKDHRLIFPFWVTTGDGRFPVYVQARDINATDKGRRFLNPSGGVPCLYNVDAVIHARTTGRPVYLCEGPTDTLNLTQAGFLTAGIIGTQGFKVEWTSLFDGLDVRLAFDGDGPGRTAAVKVTKTFVSQGLRPPKVVPLPDGQDVTEFCMNCKEKGIDESFDEAG